MPSSHSQITQWLHDLEQLDVNKYQIVQEVRKHFLTAYPALEEKFMYGGITFFLHDKMFAGVFASQAHVSVEFGNGSQMQDTYHVLEGTGKQRRHIKLKTPEDIKTKHLSFSIEQAIPKL